MILKAIAIIAAFGSALALYLAFLELRYICRRSRQQRLTYIQDEPSDQCKREYVP